MYYGTLLGAIACVVLFIVELSKTHDDTANFNITLFIYGTTITDYIGFLIGSVYFVAGG